jgi:hypothetical protein
MVHEMQSKLKKCEIGVNLGSLETRERGDLNGTSIMANRQVEGTQTPCQSSKCAKMGTTQSGKHIGLLGGSGRWSREVSYEM